MLTLLVGYTQAAHGVAPPESAKTAGEGADRVQPRPIELNEFVSHRYAEAYAEPTFAYLPEFCRYNMQLIPAWTDCNLVRPGDHVYAPPFWVLLRMRHGALPPEVENDVVLGAFPVEYRGPILRAATQMSEALSEPVDDRTLGWSAWFVKHFTCTPERHGANRDSCVELKDLEQFIATMDAADFGFLRGNLVDIVPRDYVLVLEDGTTMQYVFATGAPMSPVGNVPRDTAHERGAK